MENKHEMDNNQTEYQKHLLKNYHNFMDKFTEKKFFFMSFLII